MSLIEGDAYFPLFSNSELPIDFASAGIVPDSPGKFAQFNTRRASLALANSQTVPANFSLQSTGGPLDEPLFSLFMNGAEKMDFNGGFVKGLQIPEELLLQSGVVPEIRRPEGMMMGMDQRQFVQMGILPDPMINGDFNMVPQLAHIKQDRELDAKGNPRKRKFVPNSVKCEQGVPSNDNGQPLTAEEERNMKRQRRLVKNREAAQLFRQRQKAYIQDLEKKVADLSATNNEFRARVELLNSENKLIKEQLLYLRNFITQAVSFSFPKSPTEGDAPTTSPTSLFSSLPAGLTLPPEILGAMGSMPGMALGLMGALGSSTSLPGLAAADASMAAMSIASSASSMALPSTSAPMTRPPLSPHEGQQQANPLIPHVETNPIKLNSPSPPKPTNVVSIAAISPVAVPATIPIVPSLPTHSPVATIPPISPAPTAPTVATVPAVPTASTAAPTVPTVSTAPPATLIPPPTKPLNTSSSNVTAAAVVPTFQVPSGEPSSMVPDGVSSVKVKVEK